MVLEWPRSPADNNNERRTSLSGANAKELAPLLTLGEETEVAALHRHQALHALGELIGLRQLKGTTATKSQLREVH
jgi:hypothetical protein